MNTYKIKAKKPWIFKDGAIPRLIRINKTDLGTSMDIIKVTPGNIDKLKELGIIEDLEIIKDLEYYYRKALDRVHIVYTPLDIDNLNKAEATMFFSLILKEIAIDLDEKYPNHIRDAANIYSISLLNGLITPIDKSKIRNFKNFAAFRGMYDISIALEIIEPLWVKLFGDE